MGRYDQRSYDAGITAPMVLLMLESFKSGTRFRVSPQDWQNREIICRFMCRLYIHDDVYYGDGARYLDIIVTNDERRRLLPILKKHQNEPNKK